MADATGAGVKFSEAIEFLRRVLEIGTDEWLGILANEGATGAAIADDTVRSMIGSLVDAVLDTITEGGTLDTFRERYEEIVKQNGWAYHGDAGWHSELIFRMWTNMAFSGGRWEQAQRLEAANPGTMFARLVTVGDHRVRDSHAQMHGIVRPIGDDYWLTHWPPNGFNCRCHVQILTLRDLQRYRYELTRDGDPRLLVEPDPGWAFNPGISGALLERVRRQPETA